MARDRFGADWILNNDADEFWYPASGDLRAELKGLHANMLECRRRNMLFPHDVTPSSWSSSLIYRHLRPLPMPPVEALLEGPFPCPYLYFDLPTKVLVRAQGLRRVEQGNHGADYGSNTRVPSKLIDIYHYPVRSFAQFKRKISQGGTAYELNREIDPAVGWHWRRWHKKLQQGNIEGAFRETLPSREQFQNDLAEGCVAKDLRMFEALRETAPSG